jgi:uncharacterized phage protein gp47/JayE
MVDEEVILSGSTGQIVVRALVSGTESLLQEDDELEATSPIELVDSLAIVDSVDTTPVEAETLEEYREKVLLAFRLEPQGGAVVDYRLWSLDAQGVRTSYPYTKDGEPFAVQVYVECTVGNEEPGMPVGYPTAALLSDVVDVIELDPDTTKDISDRGRRPLSVYNLEVLPIVPVPVTIIITDLSDKSGAVVSAIQTAIEDLLYTVRPYIAGADGTNKKDVLTTAAVISAVFNSIDASINFSAVQIEIDSVIVAQYTFGNIPAKYGNYPYLFDLQTP